MINWEMENGIYMGTILTYSLGYFCYIKIKKPYGIVSTSYHQMNDAVFN